MIIPIGHEDSETRRLPWVTFSVIALCFAAWIATLVARETLEVLPPEHYQERALAFWEAHPFLEVDEALAFYALEQERPELFEAGAQPDFSEDDWNLWLENKRIRASFSADSPSRKASELEEQAAELQRLTVWGFYLDPHEVPPEGGTPAQRFGLTPADASWYGFFTHIFMHASWAHILGNLFLFYLIVIIKIILRLILILWLLFLFLLFKQSINSFQFLLGFCLLCLVTIQVLL